MDIFPLNIFPQGSLSSSVITTVWIGLVVVCFFNLRLGWVLSGLVVPGYLVPLMLIKPWSAAVVLLEGFISYFIIWFLSEYLSRYAAWSSFFGRDRFFALVLCSIVVRLFFDGYVLPEIGEWVNQTWQINFDYSNNLHSFGLIIIALIANQFWKTGFIKGLIPLFVTLGLTLFIVRYGLMELTNFSLSNISYLYEGVAESISSSPKAYIVLITTAFLASRMNLVYGWDFNGILIPSLLALQWYEPIKIIATVIESTVILLLATLLLKAPGLNKMTIEGARKLLLFFNISFVYKIALAYAMLAWFPMVKITDFYGFGYVLSTLIAIKIHDKGIFARLLGATLGTSLASVICAGLVGFGLTLLPISQSFTAAIVPALLNKPIKSLPQDLNTLLNQAQLSFYQTKVNNSFVKPTDKDIAAFSMALKLLKAYLNQADSGKLQQAAAYLALLDYRIDKVEGRYLYLHEKEPLNLSAKNSQKGWGVYVLDTQTQSELGLEVPDPLDEDETFAIGGNLFKTLGARSLAVSGSYRKARSDLSADVLQNEQTLFHYFHQNMSRHNSLQIRAYTEKTARAVAGKRYQTTETALKGLQTTLWIKSKIPADLNLPLLKKMLSSWQVQWGDAPFESLQRQTSRDGFAELMLNTEAVHKLLFGALQLQHSQVSSLDQDLSIEGYLQDWILTRKGEIAERGSESYIPPKQGELLFLDEHVLTPLMTLMTQYEINKQWNTALLNDLQLINRAASLMGYQLIRYHHKSSQQNYLILTEQGKQRRFWGLYVFRLGDYKNYTLQVPRPLYDINSFEYGSALFERLQAKGLMVATTRPDTNSNGSADLTLLDNRVNLFNLVHQVLARSLPDQPLLMVSSRAFAYNPEQGLIDADILLAFKQGYVNRESLNVLESKLLETLESDGLQVELVGGSAKTLGYEVGNIAQAKYLDATENKNFVSLWVSPQARANYRQQNENFLQEAQFNALGVNTINQELLDYIQQQKFSGIQDLTQLQALVARYAESQDVLQLQTIVQQARKQNYSLIRLLDINSRQAFLIIVDKQQKLIAIANLLPRTKQIISLNLKQLTAQLTEFINQRSFWLQTGQP